MKQMLLAGPLVMAGLAAGCTGKPAERQSIACTDSPLAVPFHMPLRCSRLPFDNGGFPTCEIESYLATGADQERQFLARSFATSASNRAHCYVGAGIGLAQALHGAATGGNPPANFGDTVKLRGGYAMTFSRTVNGASRDCFAYIKYGPQRREGYDSIIQGFVCNLNATIPDETAMQAVIDGVGVPY